MACLVGGHALKDVANWDKHAEARSDSMRRLLYSMVFAISN